MRGTILALALSSAGLLTHADGSRAAEGAAAGRQHGPPVEQQPDQVIRWNRTLLGILRTAGAQPPTVHPTRSYAILHLAIAEAVGAGGIQGSGAPVAAGIEGTGAPVAAGIQGTGAPLAAGIEGSGAPPRSRIGGASPPASAEAAAAAAAHRTLVALYPAFTAALDAQLAQALAAMPEGPARSDGVRIGEEAADRILAQRRSDGSDASPPPFVPRGLPGFYAPTPPNFPTPAFTHWSRVTPFVLQRADAFRPGPAPSLTTERYARDLEEVRSLGQQGSAARSADQTEIGRFWGGAIQNYWNEIAQAAALARGLDLAHTARLFATLNVALADGAIAFYDAKYAYEVWRPVTAIRQADTDGNPETAPDPAWLPLPTNTAPDPSYPGAHSVISAAASRVLAALLGDGVRLDVTSETLPGVTRTFSSFSAAAEEAGLSRIYAGQHFRFDHEAGRTLGRRVADRVLEAWRGPAGP